MTNGYDTELTWNQVVSKHEAPDSCGHGSSIGGGVPQAKHSRQLLLEMLLSDTCIRDAHQLAAHNMAAKRLQSYSALCDAKAQEASVAKCRRSRLRHEQLQRSCRMACIP